MLEYDVFGRRVLLERLPDGGWRAYYAGADGKRQEASDLRIPAALPEVELARYLGDHYHELASPARPDVRRVR